MPAYIERGGEQALSPPFVLKNVEFYSFLLKADPDRLQAVCDRYLNDPSGGTMHFSPASASVALVFTRIPHVHSSDPCASQQGWFTELEAAIWMPISNRGHERLSWFHPYMFVDNSLAMAAGREIYGFSKGLGWFEMPESPETADHFAVDVVGLTEIGPQNQQTRHRFIEVTRQGTSHSSMATATWKGIESMTKEMVSLLRGHSVHNDAKILFSLTKDILQRQVWMVFLKQFRDATHFSDACFQSIIELPTKVTAYHSGGFLPGEYAVTIHELATHPIHDELGIDRGTIHPLASFWTRMDTFGGAATELWRAK